jgi:nucleoside phosphorylase
MVGIAFGIDPEKQSIGDVLVSKQLMLYELQRVGTKDGNPKIIPRGDKAHASTRLLNHFRSADLSWDESKCKVSFGLILSGEKLVDNIDFRQQLCDLDPEAVGGEMEGAGLYVACHDSRVDWILVKSICDWADGNKNENKDSEQKLAAKNVASFVLYMLQKIPSTRKSGWVQESHNVEVKF